MMLSAKKTIIYSVVGFLFGLALASLYDLNICRSFFCSDIITEGIGIPISFLSIETFLFSLILLFRREEIFRAWFKFARVYIPITLIFIFLAALSPGGGSWGISNNFDSEAATWFFSGLFFFISLVLIFWKSWKLRKSTTV